MKHPNAMAWILAVAAIGASACSRADEPPQSSRETPPAVIDTLQAQGFELFGEFDAPGGLRGFAGLAGQRPLAVYVTPDGEHALVGTLLDANGQDVGQPHLQRLVEGPVSERIRAQLEKSHWVGDGRDDAPRIVYVFSDPNCPYCHRFWQAARPWVDAGKVQLRHVLVGVIREDSANKVAAILAAPSPAKALEQNERSYSSGGITGLASVPADVREKLDSNELLMLELGFQGTPGIVFPGADGTVERRSGLPPEADLPAVLGPR